MTTLTVNLLDPESRDVAMQALSAFSARQTVTAAVSDRPHTPLFENEPTPATAIAREQDATADAGGNEPDPNATDIHGLTWDADIHSTPPRLNADGSWRMRKGKKAEYEAAIAAAQEPAPAPMMPTGPAPEPQPAAPAPTAPAPLVEYETMARRFMSMMESGAIQDYNAVYGALQIDYAQLETNQTMIDRIWHYMDALEQGETHDAAVRHAMGAA